MSGRLNTINECILRADYVLEQVDPTGMEDLLPEEGDTPEELFEKRWRRFLFKPHISRSYAIGGGVNVNHFLPPGISMTGESIDEFNQMVTSFPPYWWQNPADPMYDTYWDLFISGIFIYGIEWSGSDFTSTTEWIRYIVNLYYQGGLLFDDIMSNVTSWFTRTLGWTLQQVDAFLTGAWDGITDWTKWLWTILNTLPIPMIRSGQNSMSKTQASKIKLKEQNSAIDRIKKRHRDENESVRVKHEREIDIAQRRERNRRRTRPGS